jgi:hypothetical protein
MAQHGCQAQESLFVSVPAPAKPVVVTPENQARAPVAIVGHAQTV